MRQGRQLGAGLLGNHFARKLRRMANNRTPIPGQSQIKFKTITAVGQSQIEGGDSILYNGVIYPGAAMAEQQGRGEHTKVYITLACQASR